MKKLLSFLVFAGLLALLFYRIMGVISKPKPEFPEIPEIRLPDPKKFEVNSDAVDRMLGRPVSDKRAREGNKLTIVNGTSKYALVRIKGKQSDAVLCELSLEPGETESATNLPGGDFVDYVRFGTHPDEYSYLKGSGFHLTGNPKKLSTVTLTLHKEVHGNYERKTCSASEFD